MDATEDLNRTVDLTADSSSDENEDDDDDVVCTGEDREVICIGASAGKNVTSVRSTALVKNGSSQDPSILIAEELTASKHVDHNLKTYDSMRPGDLVEFHRGLYKHWGVVIGDGKIIHLSGEDDDGLSATANHHFGSVSGSLFTISGVNFEKAKVKCDDFWDVARKSRADINNSKDQYIRADAPHVIVKRALSKMGNIGYNMLWSNCEHFASWCRYGMAWSEQVDKFMRIFDRGKSMLTSAMMLLGLTPARMKPYLEANTSEGNGEAEARYPPVQHFQ